MERKSFNELLKEQERLEAKKQDDGHVALDDAKRIKVLSPGQLVFKRFIRNKLAIFGVCVLLFMASGFAGAEKDPQYLLVVRNLKKYFPIKSSFFKVTVGNVKAVDDISFKIKRGTTMVARL